MRFKTFFKFIAICLIQAMLLCNVCFANQGYEYTGKFNTEYLSAKLAIDIGLFTDAFDKSYYSAASANDLELVLSRITEANIQAIEEADIGQKIGILKNMYNDLLMNPELKLTDNQFKVLTDIVWQMDSAENDRNDVLIVLSQAIINNHDLLSAALVELEKSSTKEKLADFIRIITAAIKFDKSIKFSLDDFSCLIRSVKSAEGSILKSVVADCINYAIGKDLSLAQELVLELPSVKDDLSIDALSLVLLDVFSQNQGIVITQAMLDKLLDYTIEVNKQPQSSRFPLIAAKAIAAGQNLTIDPRRIIKIINKIETLEINKGSVSSFPVLLSEILINDISLLDLFLRTPIDSKTKNMLAIAVSLAGKKKPDIFTREILLNLFKQLRLEPFLLELKPEGNSAAAVSYIAETLLNISANIDPELPKDFPALKKKARVFEINDKDLPFDFEKAADVYILGRTIIVVQQGQYYALKLLKKNETTGILEYEHRVMEWVDKEKDKLKLECEYAQPVFIKGQRVLKIKNKSIPDDIREKLEAVAKKDGKFKVSQSKGNYTFSCYKVKGNNAFTYLNHKSISEDDFMDSSKRFLHDLAVFSKMGIMNTSLIELFHSLENQRRYLWMIDVLSPVQSIIFDRLGAGVVRGFSKTSEYPNPRIRFMADLAEFRTIERIIRFKQIGDRVIEKDKKKILASYLGDYLFSWVFIYASRLKKQGKLTKESFDDKNFINDIADNIKQVFLYFLGQFIDDKAAVEEISRIINWKRLATQIVFYMGGAYKDYIAAGKIPQRVHGKYTKVMLKNQTSNYFDGWGYFDISLLSKNLPRTIKNHIIKTYLLRINNKTEISTIYRIVQDKDLAAKIAADEIIPENYKPRLISLLLEYQHGFRFDGVNEDLGPFNGPNPLTELIKALYVFSSFIVNEQGDQIQKPDNLKADKLNSNSRNPILPKVASSSKSIGINPILVGQAI